MLTNSTQRYLALTLMDMCVDEPLEGITVTALSQRADITRPTFYNHFENIAALIRYAAFLPLYTIDTSLSYKEMMRETCLQNLRHKEFYSQLGDAIKFSPNWQYGLDFLDGETEKNFSYRKPDTTELENARAKHRYLDACTAAIFRLWWGGGLVAPVDEIVEWLAGIQDVIFPEHARGPKRSQAETCERS